MPGTNVHDVVAAIHKKAREQAASYETPVVLGDWSDDLAKLNNAYDAAYQARNLVGSAPQLPGTLVGIVAGWVTSIVQRMLFWYTPQIQHFQETATSVLNRLCSLEERKFRSFLAMSDRLERLEREVRLLRASQADSVARPIGATSPDQKSWQSQHLTDSRSDIGLDNFYSELQRRIQSDLRSDGARLKMYQSVIKNLDPKLPKGMWLDVGCGSGRWLEIARDSGNEAIGVDSDRAAQLECREKGFDVTESDALEFLRLRQENSLAAVTAFHFLECCPFDYCLNVVHQIARSLKPGGLLLIESPHSANLLVGSEQFWIDPARQRPIPIALMEFLFEYCGFEVVHRFELDPRPDSERLPLLELELASRIDHLIHGPQVYAVLGRLHG